MGGKRVTTESYMEDVKEIHKDKGYTYRPDWEYTGSKCLIEVHCPEHGWWTTKAYSHRGMRSGCPECAEGVRDRHCERLHQEKLRRKERELFDRQLERDQFVRDKFYSIYKGELELLSVCFPVGSHVRVKCLKHNNIYMRSTRSLWLRKGCVHCVEESISAIPWEEVYERFVDIHGNRYNYDEDTYVNSHTPLRMFCKEHGEFWKSPHNHTGLKSGCPSCSNYGFNPSKPGNLYYMRINSALGPIYKIGITNRDVQKRFLARDRSSMEIIAVWHYEHGGDAYEEEQRLLNKYKEHRYQVEDNFEWSSAGYTEMFDFDVLGLDV